MMASHSPGSVEAEYACSAPFTTYLQRSVISFSMVKDAFTASLLKNDSPPAAERLYEAAASALLYEALYVSTGPIEPKSRSRSLFTSSNDPV